MKLIVFCAVGFACVAPLCELWRLGAFGRGAVGLFGVAVLGGALVPLAWVGLSFAIVRRGLGRDRLILALMLCSTSVALGSAGLLLIMGTIPSYLNRNVATEPRIEEWILAINIATIAFLAGAAVFLVHWLRKLRTKHGARISKVLLD
jgi:hypothetical protein